VSAPNRWQVLEACPVADEAVWVAHAAGFAAAFVVPAKRERWHWLLTTRPRRVGRDSAKLHADLDRRTCRRVEGVPATVRGGGVFYGFGDAPRVVPAGQAWLAAGPGDAIFSVVPGGLALYFFHEGEVWLCQSPPG
jgi:hypothetical protein